MSEQTFNINELLEQKKHLESKIKEKTDTLNDNELKYVKEVVTDHKNNTTRDYTPREKIALNTFLNEFNGLVDQLASVKTAIQRYNAESVLGKLHEREATRLKQSYVTAVKKKLLREKQYQRKILRQDKDGGALETSEVTVEPMFEYSEVEKLLDTLAATERRVNTEIQKINLNAEIKLNS